MTATSTVHAVTLITAHETSLGHASVFSAGLAVVVAVCVVAAASVHFHTVLHYSTIRLTGCEVGVVCHLQGQVVHCVVATVSDELSISRIIVQSDLDWSLHGEIGEEVCLSLVTWGSQEGLIVATSLAGLCFLGAVIHVFGAETFAFVLQEAIPGTAPIRDGEDGDRDTVEMESGVDGFLTDLHMRTIVSFDPGAVICVLRNAVSGHPTGQICTPHVGHHPGFDHLWIIEVSISCCHSFLHFHSMHHVFLHRFHRGTSGDLVGEGDKDGGGVYEVHVIRLVLFGLTESVVAVHWCEVVRSEHDMVVMTESHDFWFVNHHPSNFYIGVLTSEVGLFAKTDVSFLGLVIILHPSVQRIPHGVVSVSALYSEHDSCTSHLHSCGDSHPFSSVSHPHPLEPLVVVVTVNSSHQVMVVQHTTVLTHHRHRGSRHTFTIGIHT